MICQMTCPQILNYLLSIYLSPFRYLIKISRSNHPEVFCKKGVLGNFTKFKGKHQCQGLFFNKVKGLRPPTLLKKRLWHKCFPVNFAEISKNTFCYRATSGGCSKKKERKKSQMIIIVGVDNQKQPAEVFYKKGVLKDSAKFTGKHLYQSLFFNKVAGLWLWHRCFRVIFARF